MTSIADNLRAKRKPTIYRAPINGQPSEIVGRYSHYKSWRQACKKNGISRFEGDKDICCAWNHNYYAEWFGDSGKIEKKLHVPTN